MTPPTPRVSPPAQLDEGKLWSFLRKVLSQGGDIQMDHTGKSYEQYSARLDAAAGELVEQFASLSPAGTGGATTPAHQAADLEQALDRLEGYGQECDPIEGALAMVTVRAALASRAPSETPAPSETNEIAHYLDELAVNYEQDQGGLSKTLRTLAQRALASAP